MKNLPETAAVETCKLRVSTLEGFPVYGSQEYSEMIWQWTQAVQRNIQYSTYTALSNIELWHLREITSDVVFEIYSLLGRTSIGPIEEICERFWLVCYGVSKEFLDLKFGVEVTHEYLNRLRFKAHNP